MIVKTLTLTLIFLALSGCSSAFTSTPAGASPTSGTQAQGDLPTEAHIVEPTAVPITPKATSRAQIQPSPAERPTATSTPMPSPTSASPPASPAFSYPIGVPGRPLGDGFFIRDGVGVENTWYNPGWWHTGEDWYAQEGDTAGARVYAVAAGEIVYADANYPGRVVIIRHADDLYSMYGHLNSKLAVQVGQKVARGDLLGTVLRRGDTTPNHMHFEIRTFLIKREVNGATPRYGYRCGPNCPPGPGYWPIDAPDLPSDLGWRNPTHVIAHRAFPPGKGAPLGEVVVATRPVSPSVTLWSNTPEGATRQALGELDLRPGERFALLDVRSGPEDARATSALAYQLWYRIRLPDERSGWVQAAVPSSFETGADGRPSSISFNFYPAISAAP